MERKKGLHTPCFAKKVCNFRGEEKEEEEKRIEYMPKSAAFALKRKKSGI